MLIRIFLLFTVAVAHHTHGDKAQCTEQYGIGEQSVIAKAQVVNDPTGEQGCGDLRRHGEGVVKTGVFAYVTAGAHFNNHGEGVYIDRRPADTDQGENEIHHRCLLTDEKGNGIANGHYGDAGKNGFLASQFAGEETKGQEGLFVSLPMM